MTINQQSLAITTMESLRMTMRTSLTGLATGLPVTGNKATKMKGLATSKMRLAPSPQNTWGSRIEAI